MPCLQGEVIRLLCAERDTPAAMQDGGNFGNSGAGVGGPGAGDGADANGRRSRARRT